MKNINNHLALIFVIAALSSVTPLAIDAYLPSMPQIAQDLNVTINKIELTISIFLIFFAIGQLMGGILSDRVGRKTTALIGLFVFSFSSFCLFFTQTIEYLYVFRAIQAFFGAMATVNSAAIIRDLFHGKEAAKMFSAIASIVMIAPMLAPALGSFIISFYEWNYIFLFLGFYSFFVFIFVYFKLPLTGIKTKTKIKEAYLSVLFHKKAMGYILCVSFAFSGMFIFISKSSYIYMEYFKVSVELFPFFFGANVFMMIVLTRVNMKLIKKLEPLLILKIGVGLQFLAAFCLFIFSFNANLITVFISIVLYIGALGFIFGNAMALALDFFNKNAGVAASIIGVSEFAIGGFIGFLSSLIHSTSLTPIFLMMILTSLLSIFSLKLSK